MSLDKQALIDRGGPLLGPAAAHVAEAAPAFDEVPLKGRVRIRLADYVGKVVYLDFWASWCSPCRRSLPWLERLHREHNAAGLEVIGINVDEKAADARAFLRRYPVGYPTINDAGGAIAARYNVLDVPTSFLIDRAGCVRSVHHGFRPADATRLRRALAILLREASPT
ncbi:MAG TPA: TlpA disulfide reductase family protein [Verrucomicrobiae bacterium]|nr:TlpA disulfide reductase family protein [Verrucomicrobiae bacterium]